MALQEPALRLTKGNRNGKMNWAYILTYVVLVMKIGMCHLVLFRLV